MTRNKRQAEETAYDLADYSDEVCDLSYTRIDRVQHQPASRLQDETLHGLCDLPVSPGRVGRHLLQEDPDLTRQVEHREGYHRAEVHQH
jgi:hypothetical protein